MVNIEGLGRIRPANAAKTNRTGSSGNFAKLLGGSAAVSGIGAPSSLGSIESLLAAQEAGDATYGRSRGKARAEALLDRLDELRGDIVCGSISVARLRAIADLVATQRDTVDDPKLAGILDEIDLRAQVELAKLSALNA